jgi:hypothetical protein
MKSEVEQKEAKAVIEEMVEVVKIDFKKVSLDAIKTKEE